MTWGKKMKWGQYRCQPEEEIIALLFLLILPFLSPVCLSCSLCPILSGVRPPDLVMQTEIAQKKEEEEIRELRKGKMGFYHSFLPPPTLRLSRVLIITRFCVTSLNKALPCLFRFLPASVCLGLPLQGLTIIRSTDTQTHSLRIGMLGDRTQRQCACKFKDSLENNTPAS